MQLTYASRPFGFDDAMLAGILLDARRCNTRDDITGALIVRRDIYLQLLEGPPDMVEAAYKRIRRDDRHTEVRGVRRTEAHMRIFPEWAMKDDPARSWMWSPEEVAQGEAEAATAQQVLGIFRRLRMSLDA
jgi:hypothetical protein